VEVLVEVLLVAHPMPLVVVQAVAVQETMLTLVQEQQVKAIMAALALALLVVGVVEVQALLGLIHIPLVVIMVALAALGWCLLLQAHQFNTQGVVVVVPQALVLNRA
jgi:hypothetical protein